MVDELSAYPVRVSIPVAWGEMDMLGHLNNIYYFRYFETVRIRYLEEAGLISFITETGIGPVLAETSCVFKKPIQYPDTVEVGASVKKIDQYSFVMEHLLVSRNRGIAARAQAVMVTIDYRNGGKVEMPAQIREAIERIEGRTI